MKGVINKGLQDLVESEFGVAFWERIKKLAGCDEPYFEANSDYPDKITLDLVSAAAEVTGRSTDSILVEFGKFWLPNTGRATYPTLYKLAGTTPREFLRNLNRIHETVARNVPNASPPNFVCEDLPDGRIRMHYKSKRELCPVFKGLILGVGILFDQKLEVQEVDCTRKGGSKCTMEISFP